MVTELTREQRLALWLRPVTTEGARIASIAEGLTAFTASWGAPILDLVLLAYGRPAGSAAERLRAAVAPAEASFVGSENDLETRIVASLAVADLLDNDPEYASLAVLSAEFLGLTAPVEGLQKLAAFAAEQCGERARRRVHVPLPKATDPFKAFVKPEGEHFDATEIVAFVSAVRRAHRAGEKALEVTVSAAREQIALLNEELELLSWVVAGRVDGDGEAYAQGLTAGAFLAGVDLAGRITGYSVPAGSHGLLRRVLGGESHPRDSVVGAAAGLPTELPAGGRHTLTPVIVAYEIATDMEVSEGWSTLAQQRTGLEMSAVDASADLALQVVRELILAQEL